MDFPKLKLGSVLPTPPNPHTITELKNNDDLAKQHSHDYKIAIISIIGGGVAGFISSMIVWLITK